MARWLLHAPAMMTRTIKLGLALSAVSLAACAFKMDKSAGFGGSTSSAGGGGGGGYAASGAGASGGTSEAGGGGGGDASDPQATGHYKDYPRYPEAPADPWRGVAGDQPVRGPDHWKVRASPFECTARHDHCLDPITWFFETDQSRDGRPGARIANPGAFLAEGVMGPGNTRHGNHFINEDNGYTAYRTVPVTRKNLVPGALVIALAPPNHTPPDGGQVYDMYWRVGMLDRVDWEIEKLFLVGDELESIPVQGARIAVLSWRKGGKVTILGGKKRDQLAVRADEVILPAPKAAPQ